MSRFRNLKSQVEFKKIFENNKITNNSLFDDFKLNEDMKFSNTTGFSESLVGRAVNKLFSFGKTQLMYQYLNQYKEDVEDIYLKAVIATFTTLEISYESEKTQIQEEPQKIFLFKNYIPENAKETEKQILALGFQEDIALAVVKDLNEISELEKQQKEAQKEKAQTGQKDVQQDVQQEEKRTIIDKYLKEMGYDNKTIKITKFVESETPDKTTTNQISFMDSTLKQLSLVGNLSKENISALAKINKQLEKEKEVINKDSIGEISNIQSSINKFTKDNETEMSDDDYTKLKNKKSLSISNEEISREVVEPIFRDIFQNYSEKYKKLLEEEKTKSGDETQQYLKIKKSYKQFALVYHPDKILPRIKTKKDVIKELLGIREFIKNQGYINESKKYVNINVDLIDNYIYDLIKEDDNSIIKPVSNSESTQDSNTQQIPISNTEQSPVSNTDNNQKSTLDDITTKIKDLKDNIENKLKSNSSAYEKIVTSLKNNKMKFSSIKSDTPELKKAVKDAKNISFSEFNPLEKLEKLKKEDKTKIEKYYKIVVTNVNKEALKVIALKAEMLYNRDTYKDARNDVYSRINFTTTDPDKMKLEQKWKIKISEVKSTFMSLFSNTGSFPQDLDPIALIESDKTMRKNFQEYNQNAKDLLKNNNMNKTFKSKQEEKIKLTPEPLYKNNNYIFEIEIDNHNYYLFFNALNKDGKNKSESKINVYHFKGIILIDELFKSDEFSEEKVLNLSQQETLSLINKYSMIDTDSIKNYSKNLKDGWTPEKLNRYVTTFEKYSKYLNTGYLYNSDALNTYTKEMIILDLSDDNITYSTNNSKISITDLNYAKKALKRAMVFRSSYYVEDNQYWSKLNDNYKNIKLHERVNPKVDDLKKLWDKNHEKK